MADRGYRGRPQRGERADRQINAGHSRGLDAALVKTEAAIRNLKTERIYAFDENGKELAHSTTGTEHNTKLPKGNYKDSILTHNHPGEGMGNNMAGRIGKPFSADDIRLAVNYNVKEIRAVTKGYTYSIKRPEKGWFYDRSSRARMVSAFGGKSNQYSISKFVKRSEYAKNKVAVRNNYQETRDRIDVVTNHQTLKEICKELGWIYTRKRTS